MGCCHLTKINEKKYLIFHLPFTVISSFKFMQGNSYSPTFILMWYKYQQVKQNLYIKQSCQETLHQNITDIIITTVSTSNNQELLHIWKT